MSAGLETEQVAVAIGGAGVCTVVDAGAMTTIQDLPGRVGYWHVGVPPSGPMDDLGHRLTNLVVDLTDPIEVDLRRLGRHSVRTLRFFADDPGKAAADIRELAGGPGQA